MTDEHRIDKLEERVDRIEDELWRELKEIKSLLTVIQVNSAKNACPAPGTCLILQQRIGRLENTYDTVAKTVADLIRWRAWLTGVNLVVSSITLLLLGVACNYIIKHL